MPVKGSGVGRSKNYGLGRKLLFGQSFLSRFKSWSIDNGKHALVLE